MRTILGYNMRSFIAFISLLTAILISTNIITKQQKDDGLILNISGRQRMLTQKMVKEVLICFNLSSSINRSGESGKNNSLEKWKKEVFSTMELFESTLQALKYGGKISLNSERTEFREAPPAPTREIASELEKVFSIWVEIKNNIDKLIYSDFVEIDALNYVINHNMELLEQTDKTVLLMQHEVERKIKLMYYIQLIAIGAGIVIVIFSIFMIKINIVEPIEYFTETAEAMSMGRLDYQLKESGLKEINALSKSMNRLRVSTVKLLERLKIKNE